MYKYKFKILSDNGFIFNFVYQLYINHNKKKIFSIKALEEYPIIWIISKIKKINNNWEFYFSVEPSNEIKETILKNIVI